MRGGPSGFLGRSHFLLTLCSLIEEVITTTPMRDCESNPCFLGLVLGRCLFGHGSEKE